MTARECSTVGVQAVSLALGFAQTQAEARAYNGCLKKKPQAAMKVMCGTSQRWPAWHVHRAFAQVRRMAPTTMGRPGMCCAAQPRLGTQAAGVGCRCRAVGVYCAALLSQRWKLKHSDGHSLHLAIGQHRLRRLLLALLQQQWASQAARSVHFGPIKHPRQSATHSLVMAAAAVRVAARLRRAALRRAVLRHGVVHCACTRQLHPPCTRLQEGGEVDVAAGGGVEGQALRVHRDAPRLEVAGVEGGVALDALRLRFCCLDLHRGRGREGEGEGGRRGEMQQQQLLTSARLLSQCTFWQPKGLVPPASVWRQAASPAGTLTSAKVAAAMIFCWPSAPLSVYFVGVVLVALALGLGRAAAAGAGDAGGGRAQAQAPHSTCAFSVCGAGGRERAFCSGSLLCVRMPHLTSGMQQEARQQQLLHPHSFALPPWQPAFAGALPHPHLELGLHCLDAALHLLLQLALRTAGGGRGRCRRRR